MNQWSENLGPLRHAALSLLRRPLTWLALGSAVAAGAWAWPIVDPNRAQDRCSFGTVSNEDYRSLLARAELLAANDSGDWISYFAAGHVREGSDILQRQYRTLSAGLSSIPERVAAVHAIARSQYAEFRHVEPDRASPWGSSPAEGPAAIVFVYRFNVNRVGEWHPIRRWVRIRASFAIDDISPGFERARGIARNTLLISLTARDSTPRTWSPHRSEFFDCPPIPSAQWQAEFLHDVGSPRDVEVAPADDGSVEDLLTVAENFLIRGRLRIALPLLERALAVGEAELGQDHVAIADILDRLAEVNLAAGQASKAADFAGRALDLRIQAASRPGLRQ